MSKFMFVMFEGGGNVPVQLAAARRLVARGHTVHVLGDAPIEAPAIAAGCTFAPFVSAPKQNMRDRELDIVRDWSAGNPMSQFARVARELVFGPAERYARDVLAEIERHPVDALAIDCLLFGALAAAERSGLPTAQLHHMPFSLPTPGVPPFGMGFAPARGALGRMRDRVFGTVQRRMFERLGRAPVNAARAAVGLAPIASVFDQVRGQDRILVLTSRGYDFASRVELPENVAFCGPELADPTWVKPWSTPWQREAAKQPLVVVALGSTFQRQAPAIQRVIDALGTLPVRGLVTLGGVFSPSEFTTPANVVAVAAAPHSVVIPEASVVVAHGGHGTVMKALANGKPVLCIPLGRDQADNAARVVEAGAGLRAKPSASVASLAAAIGRMLDEPAFAASAQRLASEIAADVAADRAIAELERLAGEGCGKSRRVTGGPGKLALAALMALVAVIATSGCGDDVGQSTSNDAAVDSVVDTAVDSSPAVPSIGQVQCGQLPPIGPGNIAEFQKHVLDPATFPDALCNDGTPARLYYRPYVGVANRNKWIINLHGGGVCNGGQSCLARWCNCSNTTECPYTTAPTNFTRLTMTNAGPAQKSADGVFLRGGTGAQTNPYGDYNQVEMSYCTSDAWKGNVRNLVMDAPHPKTGQPVEFSVHFLGARVLDANLATLRHDGTPALVYTLGGASTAMPDLDDATELIVTGDSAGGAGVISNLDYISTTLAANDTRIYGLIDAVVGPSWEPLDFSTHVDPTVRSYDNFLTLIARPATAVSARTDSSCLAYHAGDTRRCRDETHVIRHHITTPFFVRMALRDNLISGNYIDSGVRTASMQPMTVGAFALTLHGELSTFDQMLQTAEEKAAMTRAPGVFAPGCTKHDTIHSTLDTYQTTITPAGGTPLRLFQVFDAWRSGGSPTNVLTQSVTLDDTVCP